MVLVTVTVGAALAFIIRSVWITVELASVCEMEGQCEHQSKDMPLVIIKAKQVIVSYVKYSWALRAAPDR